MPSNKTSNQPRVNESGTHTEDMMKLPQMICPGVLYRASVAMKILGVKDWSWRQMRRQGLLVLYEAGKSFVLGDSIIEYFNALAANQSATGRSTGGIRAA